ncbi:uncharacterized protein LOC104415025 isoform X2 [Eucalyptus grandis]|uniref:uncharacterized protein LOC104415025 isoform X2 n=1 Tax=Eucalyptus grandis TaxID=71139 RepID=UPI00192ED7E6|nr:uncharacterized protein LOC104415025 isoform X2 [Eucalyptus grandis]
MDAATGEHYRIFSLLLAGAVHAAAAATAVRARRLCRIPKPPVHVGSRNALGFVRRHVEIAAPPSPLLLSPSVFAGKKALWEHCVYGFTPTIGSANHLLQYAKEHKDATLMQEVMKLLKKNNLPLRPTTANIVFSICDDTDSWGLLTKYSKRFVKNGVNLHKAAFDIWMEFAAKVGDIESLWKTEKLRCESMKQHTVGSGFSCAKGYLLEGKPEEAATVIHVLNQSFPDAKRSSIMVELQKLVSEWLFEVIKRKKEDDHKALAASFKSNIPATVSSLLNTGLEVKVNMEQLTTEGTLC